MGPNEKGNIAELVIAAEAAKLHVPVLKPLTEHERYDLVFEIGGRLLRVQCKWAKRRGDVVAVYLRTNRHTPRGYVTTTYTAAEIDLVGAYCHELGRCFLLPIGLVAGKSCIHLRLGPARNGQLACTTLAAEYDFAGAVAQLEERLAGSEEARGSSPLSSTVSRPTAETPPPAHAIGAHEFRNRFGFYLERAAAGEDVRVSRHGRPAVRLVAEAPPLARGSPVAAA